MEEAFCSRATLHSPGTVQESAAFINRHDAALFQGQEALVARIVLYNPTWQEHIAHRASRCALTCSFAPGDRQNDRHTLETLIVGSSANLSLFAAELENDYKAPAAFGQAIRKALALRTRPWPNLALGKQEIELGEKTLIMGILNVTPDSFSDGGLHHGLEEALCRAYEMAKEGADIIDIGGESTRPGHEPIDIETELDRVIPVIRALKERSFPLPLSIDTYKSAVAARALEAGAEMINDIWGLKADPQMATLAARMGVPVCIMHNRSSTSYNNLIPDIIEEISQSLDLALDAGIPKDRIIIDPGIGFGKNLEQNLEVMKHLPDFCRLGYPLLLGTSRKSMIGKTLGLPLNERIEGTAATVAWGIAAGAAIIRVHDITAMRRVAIMTDAMLRR